MKTYSVIEINKVIRKCLKEAFPAVKFSVRKDRWTIYVNWMDGPNSDQVNAIIGKFQGRGFNGYDDSSYSYYHTENGEEISINCDYLFLNREYSEEAKEKRLKIISKNWPKDLDQWEKDRALHKALSKHSYCLTKHSQTSSRFELTGSQLEDQQKAEEERQEKEYLAVQEKAKEEKAKRDDNFKSLVLRDRPVSVLVHWSESNEFKENQTLDFEEFERTCKRIVLNHGLRKGYDKTKITVTFESGNEYGCRLDLSKTCDNGFIDHINQMIEYTKTDKGYDYYSNNAPDLLEYLNNFYMEEQNKSDLSFVDNQNFIVH